MNGQFADSAVVIYVWWVLVPTDMVIWN